MPAGAAAHTAGVWLCLVSLGFTCFSCEHFILGWAPTLHGSFACSAQSVPWWSLRVRREGWGWGRPGLQSNQAVPAGLSAHPMPQQQRVSALCSSTSTAGRWACCDGPFPRQHLCAGMQYTAPVEVTRGSGEEWGQPPWSGRVLSGCWGQNWYQYWHKLGEKEGECRMWEKLRGRDNLQD